MFGLKNKNKEDFFPEPEMRMEDIKDKESMKKYFEYRAKNEHLFLEPEKIRKVSENEIKIIRKFGRRRIWNSLGWALFGIGAALALSGFKVLKIITGLINDKGLYYALPIIGLLIFFIYLLTVDENPRTIRYIKANKNEDVSKYSGGYKSITSFLITRRFVGKNEVRFLSKSEALKADSLYDGKDIDVEIVGAEAPYLVMKILGESRTSKRKS